MLVTVPSLEYPKTTLCDTLHQTKTASSRQDFSNFIPSLFCHATLHKLKLPPTGFVPLHTSQVNSKTWMLHIQVQPACTKDLYNWLSFKMGTQDECHQNQHLTKMWPAFFSSQSCMQLVDTVYGPLVGITT